MDLTVHLLTKNNETTIEKSLISLKPLNCHIVAVDRGSKDGTISICEKYGIEVVRVPFMNRCEARNHIISQGWQMYLEPWEILTMGHQSIKSAKYGAYYMTVVRDGIVAKEVRLWNGPYKFINPVFEYLKVETNQVLEAVIYSKGGLDQVDTLQGIELWKSKDPLSHEPFYYQACFLLSEGKYDEFIKISDYYMFLNKKQSISATMNRYYYALVHVVHKKKAKPAIQNLVLCLCANPLMAEFWCLAGDAYYHLLNNFDKAKSFYENAIILGRHRLRNDKWPMEIAKYKSYPEKMIKSCEEILKSNTFYS